MAWATLRWQPIPLTMTCRNFNPFNSFFRVRRVRWAWHTRFISPLTSSEHLTLGWFMLIFLFEHFVNFHVECEGRVRHLTPNSWPMTKIELLSAFAARCTTIFSASEVAKTESRWPFSVCRWPDTFFRRPHNSYEFPEPISDTNAAGCTKTNKISHSHSPIRVVFLPFGHLVSLSVEICFISWVYKMR